MFIIAFTKLSLSYLVRDGYFICSRTAATTSQAAEQRAPGNNVPGKNTVQETAETKNKLEKPLSQLSY